MQLLLTCPLCGEVTRSRTEDDGLASRCPRCDHRFPIIAIVDESAADARPRIDDTIVCWLSQSPDSSQPDSAGDVTCQVCGYAGMIRGDTVCPVCLEINVIQTPPGPPTVDCPNCGQAIALFHNDRGKTTICPGCKYFLGCVFPTPKRVQRKLGAKA